MPAEPRSTRRKRLDSILDKIDDGARDGRRTTKPSPLLGCHNCSWVAVLPGPITTCVFCREPLAPLADVHAASERRMAEADRERAARPRSDKSTPGVYDDGPSWARDEA